MKNFQGAARDILTSEGVADSPARLLEKWQFFVEECQRGYPWDFSEYVHELRPRRVLELLLVGLPADMFPEAEVLQENIEPTDTRFRALLQPGVELPDHQHGFDRGVLKYAGEPYVSYMRDAYGISVQLVS